MLPAKWIVILLRQDFLFALSLLKVLNFDIIEQERNYPVWHNKLTFMNFSQYTVKDTKEIFTLLESRESGLTEKAQSGFLKAPFRQA